MRRLLTVAIAGGAMLRAACVPVNSDRILGRDLAAADTVFGRIAPEEVIGFAPSPGHLRLFGPEELTRLALKYGVTAESFKQVCFQRITEPLTAERLIPALQKAIDMAGVEIQVFEFSRYPLPPGDLEFKRSSLPAAVPNVDSAVIWRGRLIGADRRSIPIWVKVKLLVERKWIEASTNLPSGRPIAANQVTTKTGKQFPFANPVPVAIEDVVGRKPLRSIRTGQVIVPMMLKDPDEVERGDAVAVEVTSGGAQLRFEARAESSGHKGETVAVQNPVSGRRFAALVQDKGKVLVNPDGAKLESNNGLRRPAAGGPGGVLGGRAESVQ